VLRRLLDNNKIPNKRRLTALILGQAGLVCKLNTRCSILAATNPKGKYDPHQNLEVNIALGSPLLSRFDLVLILLDTQNKEWDRSVASKLPTRNMILTFPCMEYRKVSSFILGFESAEAEVAYSGVESLWNLDKLQAYVTFVKSTCNPKLSDDSNLILKRYYQTQRASDLRNAARTTVGRRLFSGFFLYFC
jgi:DNA replicative helicase MCM subunit Mcm2 (Cdc46/Mcm family)